MASSITSYGTLNASNGSLYFEQEGNPSGHAVLFIHGLGGTTNTYQPIVPALQDFNLVRFDWAGHGRSSVPKSTSIDSYVQDALGSSSYF
jgi:pimeloyl-ACP methyl ester carboxylesterase